MNENNRCHELIALFQIDQISDEEFAELEDLLRQSPDARQRFHRACRVDSQLQRQTEALEEEPGPEASRIFRPAPSLFRSGWFSAGIAAAASVMLLATLGWSAVKRPKVIAEITSVEDAAWESSLPTEFGAPLTRGYLKLMAGIATIRFESGAEITMEAPSKLVLKSSKRAKVIAGAVIVEVPESAIGFILETPDGYAVDYGTRFAVDVDGAKQQSDFEVIEGEISVHHLASGDEVRLSGEGQKATLSEAALVASDVPEEEQAVEQTPDVLRIGTNGRATSVLPNNKREKFLPADVLAVKRTNSGRWDHRSFFAFDLSTVDLGSVESARLRLNLVPSSRGYAARLPKINRFAVYGLTNQEKADWKIDSLWEEAPSPEDGVLLGTFEIPRSIQSGSFGIQNPALREFLRSNRGDSVTFILIRETTQIEGKGSGMTHTFASDSHPEAVGPMLEFSLPE